MRIGRRILTILIVTLNSVAVSLAFLGAYLAHVAPGTIVLIGWLISLAIVIPASVFAAKMVSKLYLWLYARHEKKKTRRKMGRFAYLIVQIGAVSLIILGFWLQAVLFKMPNWLAFTIGGLFLFFYFIFVLTTYNSRSHRQK